MPFEVPASKRSVKQNQFEFVIDGQTFSIPSLKYVTVAVAELLEKEKNVEAIVLACDTDEARDAVRAMDGEQFVALLGAWAEFSGVSLGESPGSADS